MDCSVQALLNDARPLNVQLTTRELLAAQVSILCNLAAMTCNAKSLLAASTCLLCLSESQLLAISTMLLCVLAGQGGGTGGPGIVGAGSPQGVVTAPPGTNYTDNTTGNFWVKLSGTGNTGWLELIG